MYLCRRKPPDITGEIYEYPRDASRGRSIETNISPRRHMEARMSDNKFLTADEVAERYRGEITVGTLRNWRALRIGPPFVKIGKAVLYPVEQLDAWDQKNLVSCRASNSHSVNERGGA
jgi:hypothetical protein